MNFKLSGFEVLNMAEAIEQDSIDFYRKAARRFDDEERRNMFFILAGWETKHKEVFSAMKRELTNMLDESMSFDFSRVLSASPQRLQGLASSAPGSVLRTTLSGEESKEDILELAITRERNIVGFYYNLMEVMGEFIDKSKLNDIIKEEQSHIGILRRAIEKFNEPRSSVSTGDR